MKFISSILLVLALLIPYGLDYTDHMEEEEMGNFKKAWIKTSQSEGGYVNNSKDGGKETYRGISIVNNPTWKGWEIIHETLISLGITDTTDVNAEVKTRINNALSGILGLDELVQTLYKEKYWDTLKLDDEPDQSICDTTFDSAVLMGVETERKSIEEARKEADEIV